MLSNAAEVLRAADRLLPPAPAGLEFDEQRFPLADEQTEGFLEQTQRGLEQMRRSTVVIGGLARDLGALVTKTAQRIEYLGRLFADYRVVVMENDSADATALAMIGWGACNPRVCLLTQRLGFPVNSSDRSLSRAERMSHCRTRVQELILQGRADYVLLLDTDLVGGWSCLGVAHTFGEEERAWDFVGSNGCRIMQLPSGGHAQLYADVWAHRPYGSDNPLPRGDREFCYRRGEPLLPVNSCFGGLGVYTWEAYAAGRYDCYDCEHVTFHASLRKAGHHRLFLNPAQLVLY